MNLRAFAVGGALIGVSVAFFAYKTVGLGLPLAPSPPSGLWEVELQISVRGDGRRSSLRASLPSPGPRQRVFGERFSSGDLRLAIRDDAEGRVAVWTGWIEGLQTLTCSFRVQLLEARKTAPRAEGARVPQELLEEFARPSAWFPSSTEEVRALLLGLSLPSPEDRAARSRALYSFVVHEIAETPSASSDPLLIAASREATAFGKERMLVTLLRGAGFPARLVSGLELREGNPPVRHWVEVWQEGTWVPISASQGFFGELPPHHLALGHREAPVVESVGVRSVGYLFHALPHRLTEQEIGALLTPTDPVLRSLSLYQLSSSMQSATRLLLLLPLGALVVTLMRNVVGLPSYGTFMPMLIALALRGTGLGLGLALVGSVLLFGVLGRVLMERLRLLLVPRLSVLLCIVVLTVIGFGLFGTAWEQRDYFAGIFFPIVILTMLIERFSLTVAEENVRAAALRAASSTAIALVVYPIFRSDTLEHVLFGYPELVVTVMGILVVVGGYTGYRVSDLLRFRVVLERPGAR